MITRTRLLEILGIAEHGPCTDCGQSYQASSRANAAEAAADHAQLCLARLGRAVTAHLSDPAATAAVEEYVQLELADDNRTTARRSALRETIDTLLRGRGAEAWSAWTDLAGDPTVETSDRADDDADPA